MNSLSAPDLLAAGERLYAGGCFEDAAGTFAEAYGAGLRESGDVPSLIPVRAARGVAESYSRMNPELNRADVHEWADVTNMELDRVCVAHGIDPTPPSSATYEDDPTKRGVVREIIQTGSVAGKLMAREAVLYERHEGTRVVFEENIIPRFEGAWRWLPAVAPEGSVDQYEINHVAVYSLACGLYGARSQARRLAVRARQIAPLSESPQLANAATASEDKRVAAVHRATRRAQVATAALYLPRPAALWLASRAI